MEKKNKQGPLAGIRVVEFTHMVMGASAGVILGDLGAEVIKVEPIGGDPTRNLLGSGAGYFPMFNRNKRSLCLDLKNADGLAVARSLVATADVLVENFRPGTLARLGLGYEELAAANPRLIYCSAKGFLTGPYEHRTALDEVAQMMGGLAYMTGPPGRPLRAGSSVIDITGGLFGVIAVLAALERRHRTGIGGDVKCALFETTAFLVGQHMAQKAATGAAAQPMPVRLSAWAVYDVFETAIEGELLFIGIVSDSQWTAFCEAFALDDLGAEPGLRTNNQRVRARERILPTVEALMRGMKRAQIVAKLEPAGLPFAPIVRPDELFNDPHLTSGGLVELEFPNGEAAALPRLPVEFEGERLPLRAELAGVNANGAEILKELGIDDAGIEALRSSGAIP
ncbi:MAG TPA: CaiB/BaiF CoA-transferase family protein [Steroidobacteraceae bacterium]|jgi:crotonobetainyl-CoA:carnitine CoA-transferase CaiB-like acyl-CoA transferase